MTDSTSRVLYSVDASIATITLNRPAQRNALNSAMLEGLLAAYQRARADTDVRAIVLTGAGSRAFCAGADLREVGVDATGSDGVRSRGRALFVDIFLEAEALGKPLIGAINGPALAGGFGLALGCDLLVAADHATFGTPEINVGLWPMMVTSLAVRNLGRKRAMQLLLTGAAIDAATAESWGLVHRIVPADALQDVTRAVAASLCAHNPEAVQSGRDAFYAIDNLAFDEALRYLYGRFASLEASGGAAKGIAAFLENRR